jgi:hypothetical protein
MIAHSYPSKSAQAVHTVARHPQDGWTLADPAPLSRASERALHHLVWALLPPPPAPRPADIEARVERQVRCMMQYMPATLRFGFVLLLRLLNLSPLWRFRALKRLGGLSQEQASDVLTGIATSRLMPLRLLMLAPKAIVLSAYFDQDEVHAALDYEPRAFIRERTLERQEWLAREGEAQERGARESHDRISERPQRVRLEVLS